MGGVVVVNLRGMVWYGGVVWWSMVCYGGV